MCVALNTLGCTYYDLGQHERAIALLAKALRLSESTHPWFEAMVLGNLGLCWEYVERLDDALALYYRAREKHREAGSRGGEGEVLDSIGGALLRLGQPTDVVECHTQAVHVARESGTLGGEIAATNGLGAALLAAGRHDEAAAQYESASLLARQVGDQRETARAGWARRRRIRTR